MELGTFAAIFEAAIALEENLSRRYQAQSAQQSDAAAQVYRELARDGDRRLRQLERVRRETVTEMILVPITDLILSEDLAALSTADPTASLLPVQAQALEERIHDFYQKAAGKIGQDEAARALRRLAQGNARRARQLAALHEP